MSYHLFLDDGRKIDGVYWVKLPENVHWEIARSYEEFVKIIQEKGIPKFISYDCDLCDEHYDAFFSMKERYVIHYVDFKTKCGIHCLEHLLKLCKKQGVKHPDFIAHTRNHYAQGFMENMINVFNGEKKTSDPRFIKLF